MSVGSELRSAREARDLSIADVARVTRIRGTLLSNMEDDDFAACGGAVYARGHLRSFAAAVGLDAAPLIADFDATHDSVPPVVLSEELPGRVHGIRERNRPNWLAYGVGAAAVLVVLLVGVAVTGGSTTQVRGTLAQGPAKATAPETRTTSVRPVAPTPTVGPPVAALAPVTVQVKITKAPGSWVQASDGTATFAQVLSPGTTKLFTSQKLVSIIFGNAGAVDLTVNGHHIGSPGSDGQVVTSKFTPTSTTGQG